MSYKNRQRAGWASRKETKENIYKERRYAKEEIKQALQEELEGDAYRYNFNNKRVHRDPTKEAIHKTKVKIESEKKWIRIFSGFGDDKRLGSCIDRMKHSLKEYTESLKNLLTNKK